MTNDLVVSLLSLEQTFCASITAGHVTGHLSSHCADIFARVKAALSTGQFDESTCAVVRRVVGNIRVVSAALAEVDRECAQMEERTIERSRSVLLSAASAVPPGRGLSRRSSLECSPEPADDATTFTPYRQWFLDHFSNPYPSSKDKDTLLEQVTVHTRRQLDTWYTNQRRRSGWHALKRKYGHISTLLKRIDDAGEDDEEMRQARQEVERVRAYFKNDRQDHVRDEIREIISQGPPTTATKRRIEAGPPRRVVGRTQRARSEFAPVFLDNPAPAPAPLMPGSWTPYSVVQDDDFFASASTSRQQPTPGLPSDFSSPESSRRTFSGSSSSSTDSLISYDSLDIPVSTLGPGSPPASSSLLNFDGRSTFVHSSPARAPRHSPRRGSFVVRNSVYPTRPHPYFCTVNELPTGSSLARFASS